MGWQENTWLERYNEVSSLINLLKQGKLDESQITGALLPKLCNLTHIGSIKLFQTAIDLLSNFEDNVDYQFCKAIGCYEVFDYKGMAYWLSKLRSNPALTLKYKAFAAINIIFANANNGCFDNSIDWAVDALEDAVLNHGYDVFEALENLMQELETRNLERLNRYIDFLKNHKWETWKKYCSAATVLWNHYKRTEDFVSLRQLMLDVDIVRKDYTLTESDILLYELNLLRQYFEARDGRWEQFSIYIFKRYEEFLNNDLNIAFRFSCEFLNLVRDGQLVYGRYLNDAVFDQVLNAAKAAIDRHITEEQAYYDSLPIELLRERIFWNEVHLLKAKLDCIIERADILEVHKRKAIVYKRILNLCEINESQNDYLHWLLIYADDTLAANDSGRLSEELKVLAIKLNKIVEDTDYSASIAYYLIFLSKIWDLLDCKDKARLCIQKFEETGASYKVFNLLIQRDYLILVRKYLADKNDELNTFLNDLEYICVLNSNREIEEAIIRARKLFDDFPFTDTNKVAVIGAENVALLFHKCAHIFLNASQFELLDMLWKKYSRFVAEWRVMPDVSAEITLSYAIGMYRQGLLDRANELIDRLIDGDSHHKIKLRGLVLKGQIETSARDSFKLNAYAQALAMAEECGDLKELAHVYQKVAVSLGKYYPALGISFLRKAECIYERLGMIDDLYEVYLLRAQAYMAISLMHVSRYTLNLAVFLEGARDIIKEFPRSIYKSASSRAFHDRLSGILFCDIDRFNEAYLFYKRSDAYPDALLTLGTAVCTFSMNGQRQYAIQFALEYKSLAEMHNDSNGAAVADQMLGQLKNSDGYVAFVDAGTPFNGRTLFDILDNISLEEELWALDKSPVRTYFPNYKDEGKCIPFTRDDVVTLNPVGLLPFKYYRGQNKQYDKCLPSLYRPWMTEPKKFVERLKYCEFYLLLETHPILTKFRNTFCYNYPDGHSQIFNFNVYHLGLAQHYGIYTELIDVTSDKWVAAFFASTMYEDGTYYPYDGDGEGVFYTYMDQDPSKPSVQPIGIQPFSRPGEQSGYAYALRESEDFGEKADAVKFQHHREINEFIFSFTNRSQKLFPEDILETKAAMIRTSKFFSKVALDLTLRRFYPDLDKNVLESWLSQEGINLVDEPIVTFNVDDMDMFSSQWPELMESIRDRILILNLVHMESDGLHTLHSTRI